MQESEDVQQQYRELAHYMEAAFKSVAGIKEALYEHTYLLWPLLVVMFYATLVQFHDPWEGDMWALPDYEWALRHEWVSTVDDILGPHDEDGFLLGHFYNGSAPPPHYHDPSHPSHVEQLQRVIESHWESTLLTWVLNLNFLLFPTLLVRYYFFYARQHLLSILALLWVFMFSGVAQFVAVALRVGVASYTFSLWALLGIFINGVCLAIEVLAYIELYRLRGLAMFMNKQYADMPAHHKQLIGEELKVPDAADQLTNPFGFVDTIIQFLTAAKETVVDDCAARQRGKRRKEKTL